MLATSKLPSGFVVLVVIQLAFFLSFCLTSWECERGSYDDSVLAYTLTHGFSAGMRPEGTAFNRSHPPWKVPSLDNRTAVIVTLSHVNHCEAVRLKHLVDTAGMDVWVLHGHDKLSKKRPDLVERSRRYIESIPGLKFWPQVEEPMFNFDSRVSGSTKSSYLKFLLAHRKYDYAWHVESDVLFTGKWREVLGMETNADFVYTKQWDKLEKDPGWWDRIGNGTCHVDGQECKDIMPWQTYWMVVRMSRPLAAAIVKSVERGQATGHHEAIVASFCQQRKFSIEKISPDLLGSTFRCGTTVPYEQREAEKRLNTLSRSEPPERSRMYHPVKCVAYTSGYVMQAEIEQWLI